MSIPSEIKLHKKSNVLEIQFDDGTKGLLSGEYLRVFSPSAEMRGHDGKRKIIGNKKNVKILNIEPIGNYAIKFIFDDGHQSGIYTWEILYALTKNHQKNWREYLQELA